MEKRIFETPQKFGKNKPKMKNFLLKIWIFKNNLLYLQKNSNK